MEFVKRDAGTGTAKRDTSTLNIQDGGVEVLLRRGEDTIDGPGAGDVGYVSSVLLLVHISVR